MCANILGAVWIEELKNAPVEGGGTKKIWAWSCLPFSRFQPAIRIGVPPQVETAIFLLSLCVKKSFDWLVSPGDRLIG
jgi:hypothetical protein